MADCAAMAVDAVTYLFNYCAERSKNREISHEEKLLDRDVLYRQRKLLRLYLELIPPLISVTTLLAVTIISLKQAIDVLVDDHPLDNPPDVIIMVVFSALNLLLDAINVRCFARAEHHFVGIPSAINEHGHDQEETQTELTGLVKKNDDGNDSTTYAGVSQAETSLALSEDEDDDRSSASLHPLNLNMCSAWTVSTGYSNVSASEQVAILTILET